MIMIKSFSVAHTSSHQSSISIDVDKKLHIKHLSNVLIVENQDALNDDNIRRIDGLHVILIQRVCDIVVGWDLDRFSVQNVLQGFEHGTVIERIGMVKIERAILRPNALIFCQFFVKLVEIKKFRKLKSLVASDLLTDS
jgi:hypothetical protein